MVPASTATVRAVADPATNLSWFLVMDWIFLSCTKNPAPRVRCTGLLLVCGLSWHFQDHTELPSHPGIVPADSSDFQRGWRGGEPIGSRREQNRYRNRERGGPQPAGSGAAERDEAACHDGPGRPAQTSGRRGQGDSRVLSKPLGCARASTEAGARSHAFLLPTAPSPRIRGRPARPLRSRAGARLRARSGSRTGRIRH